MRALRNRVGRSNRARPEPSDDSSLTAVLESDFGIKVTDALLSFFAHPLAVVADILCQPFGALPRTMKIVGGIDGSPASEPWRYLYQRFGD